MTAYGTLKGVLERFDNLSKDLAKEETFKGTTAASEHDAFKITTNNKAVPGNYMVEVTKIVEVTKLAQAQTLTTQEKISNQTAKLGTHWRG